jgi:hypothetical protein
VIAKLCGLLRVWLSIAVGGGSGAAIPLIQSLLADGKVDHLDGHRIAITAFWGAVLAVAFHLKEPPKAACPTEPPKP